MSSPPPLVLLTGFGPFPGVPVNASGRLVRTLARAAAAHFQDLRFEAHVLPVNWASAPQRAETLLRERAPALALHFGVSARAHGFVIETRALNETNGASDHAGEAPHNVVLAPGGRPSRRTRLPVRRIVRRLEAAHIPVAVSADAGRYLCNAVMYRSLELSRSEGRAFRCGFIHVPVNVPAKHQEPGGLDWDTALRGGLLIIDACRAPLIRHG